MRKKIYEIYENNEQIARGTYEQIIKTFPMSRWAIRRNANNRTLYKRKYEVVCIGEINEEKPRIRKEEEKFDYMLWYLQKYGNTIVNEKQLDENLERLENTLGKNIIATKIPNYDDGRFEGTYHYYLEVANGL